MKKLKGAQYLIVVAGIVVVMGIVFTVATKQNIGFSCDIVDTYYNQFSYHILNALYSTKRIDEGRIRINLQDTFRFVLSKDSIEIYYLGTCKTNNRRVVRKHNLENALYSTYKGTYFCVEKSKGSVRLCSD